MRPFVAHFARRFREREKEGTEAAAPAYEVP
jgi:hypothetical protein